MAERNKSMQAIILSIKDLGENNRSVCILSDTNGLFYATQYGGAKSKFRSLIQPFNSGTLWIYDDLAKQSKKIKDFDVTVCHTSLHKNLYKIWAANFAVELMLKTHFAGDEKSCYVLLKAFIDGIDSCDENEARLGTLRFLWRYIGLLGVQPDVTSCLYCGKDFCNNLETPEENIFYIPHENGFSCVQCQDFSLQKDFNLSDIFELNKEALFYLNAINTKTPGKVRSLTIKAQTAYKVKQFLFYLAEQAAGCRLKSLQTGMGIL